MPNYSIEGTDNLHSSICTPLAIDAGSGPKRGFLYDFLFGADPTSVADVFIQLILQRFTALGSGGSTPTPRALDPADAASGLAVQEADTANATYTSGAELLYTTCHMRAPWRFTPLPGSELVIPATSNNGIGFRCLESSDTSPVRTTIFFRE